MASQLREQIHSDPHIPTASPVICVWTISRCELVEGWNCHLVIELLDNLPSFHVVGTPISSCIVSTMVASMLRHDVSKSSLDHLHPDERGRA
jgi:hypothetical protein